MSRTGNNIASVVFVLVLGLFVAQPILNASSEGPPGNGSPEEPVTTTKPEEEEPATTIAATTTTEPDEEPSPEASPSETPVQGEVSFLTEYPRRCLRPAPRPNPGLFAALQGNQVSIAPPGGAVTAQFQARGPIQWSPSGRFLAAGGGDLFTSEGGRRGALFTADADTWAWSPRADCALGVVSGTLQFGTPKTYGALLNAPIVDFAISPNGRKVALAMDDPDVPGVSLWEGSLASGVVRQIELLETSESAYLLGWDRGSRTVAFTADSASGGVASLPLRFGAKSYKIRVRPFPDQLIPCNEGQLVVGSAGGPSRLQYIRRGGLSPASGDPATTNVVAASCAPRGGFIAQVVSPAKLSRERDLILTDATGTKLQDLTLDAGYSDEYPWWGPLGTGVAFVRRPDAGGPPQIWYITEGGTGTFTGLVTTDIKGFRGHYPWTRVFDWSADVPAGVPAGFPVVARAG